MANTCHLCDQPLHTLGCVKTAYGFGHVTKPLTLAERCRIHAEKMSEEGWHVTANVLWSAAGEIERLTPQPTITVGLIDKDTSAATPQDR